MLFYSKFEIAKDPFILKFIKNDYCNIFLSKTIKVVLIYFLYIYMPNFQIFCCLLEIVINEIF